MLFSPLLFSFNSNDISNIDLVHQEPIYVSPGTVVYGQNEMCTIDSAEALIFVSADAVLYGESNITKVIIVHVQVAVVADQLVSSDTDNALGISKKFVRTEKVKDKILKKHLNQSNEKVKNTLFASAEKQNTASFFKINDSIAVFSSSSSISNFSTLSKSITKSLSFFSAQVERKENYIYLDNFQFRKVNTSFLRGPPLQMV